MLFEMLDPKIDIFAETMRMYFSKLSYILLLIPLLAFTSLTQNEDKHKFYVSATDIEQSRTGDALQITIRMFTDDLEALLQERYNGDLILDEDNMPKQSDSYLSDYISKKLIIKINGIPAVLNFLGKEYQDDLTKCYAEIDGIDDIKSLSVQNKLLFDLFEEQQNIVHVKLKNKRKSFIMIKENDKGMLNL